MAIDLPPVPQDQIGETHVWRDWFFKARQATLSINTPVALGNGVTGTFTTSDTKTVTVTNGIITSIV